MHFRTVDAKPERIGGLTLRGCRHEGERRGEQGDAGSEDGSLLHTVHPPFPETSDRLYVITERRKPSRSCHLEGVRYGRDCRATASALRVLYAMQTIGNVRKRTKVFVVIASVLGLIPLAQDPSTVRLESAISIEDPRFQDYVGAVTASPSSRGDRYEMLVNGDEVCAAMLEAIRGTGRRVHFLTYIYSPGEAANKFTSALADAGRRGLEVNVVVDAFGASDIPREHIQQFEDAGVSVGHYRPVRWYSIQESNYRNHRKILVVDGEIGFTGGVGVADHWLGRAQDKGHWRDTQFRMRGPVVRYLEAVFYESLAETLPRVTPEIGPSGDGVPPDAAGDAITSPCQNLNGGGGVKRSHYRRRQRRSTSRRRKVDGSDCGRS